MADQLHLFPTTEYMLCWGKTKIDETCARFYNDLGFKTELGVEQSYPYDLILFEDYLIQVTYPSNIKKKLDAIFYNTQVTEDIDLIAFHKILDEKTTVSVLIHKDKETVKQMKAQLLY